MHFSAKRLTIARQRRTVTKKGLAGELGITPAMITGYEAGTRTPSADTVGRIAGTLRFPYPFFFQDDVAEVDPDSVSFRSRRSLTASLRDKTVASLSLGSELISPQFRNLFDFPAVQVPDLAGESPERAAKALRLEWKLGNAPIANMVHLLESKGVEVYFLDDPSPCLDAVSMWKDGRPFVMMNLGKSGDRGRFDAAHELAHLVLHKGEDRLDSREVEREADQFAAAFLLPADQFSKECPRSPVPRLFFEAKARWKVAIQAMIRRGRDLGIYSDWQYETACRDISVMGWRKAEPVPVEREQSKLHELAYTALRGAGYTAGRFAERTHLLLEDLLELTPSIMLLGSGRYPVQSSPAWAQEATAAPAGQTVLRLVGND